MKLLLNVYFISFLLRCVYLSNETNDDKKEEKLNPDILDRIIGIKIRSTKEIKTSMELIDQPLLLFHYSKSSKASIEAGHYLYEAADKLEHIVVTLLVDCDLIITKEPDYEKCQRNEYTDGFPRVSLLASPPYRFDILTKKVFLHTEIPWPAGKEYTETNFYNFAIKDYESKAIKIKSRNVEVFLK